MTLNQNYLFKSVKLIKGTYGNVPIGSIGTVLELYDDCFFEVEFNRLDGSTLYIGAIRIEDVKFIDDSE